MAFRDFSFPEVEQELGVTLLEDDLYSSIPPTTVRDDFAATIRDGTDLALAVHTEKARSEFIIAPVLLELRRSLKNFGLFSGIEFNVDPSRGLNGYCDFILTRVPRQLVLTAPLMAVVEAKNDNIHNGLGQCIATLVAAHEFNQKAGSKREALHGVVTTGSAWKFLRLVHPEVTVDVHEYHINDLTRLMGILEHIIRTG